LFSIFHFIHLRYVFLLDSPNGSLIARKDLRDIFDQLSVTRKSKITLNSDKSRSAPELFHIPEKRKIGKTSCFDSITRVCRRI
jgi:hypothetical protein